MSFTFFDHTGDIGVRLAGRTLDDLFESAAAAFTETITDPARVEPRRQVPVTLEPAPPDLLLVDWLSEILYRFEVEQFLVARVEVHVDGPKLGANRSDAVPANDAPAASSAVLSLQAVLSGETFEASRHAIKVLVKAITYHALEVRHDADGWHATLVFDV